MERNNKLKVIRNILIVIYLFFDCVNEVTNALPIILLLNFVLRLFYYNSSKA